MVEAHNFITLKADLKEEIINRVKQSMYSTQYMDDVDIENMFLDIHSRFNGERCREQISNFIGQKTTDDALLIYSSYEDAKASPNKGDFIVLTPKKKMAINSWQESKPKYTMKIQYFAHRIRHLLQYIMHVSLSGTL